MTDLSDGTVFRRAAHEARMKCLSQQIEPTDLWIGPDALRGLRRCLEEMRFFLIAGVAVSETWDGKAEYEGMTIHFMEKNGLRAGRTISFDEIRN